MKKRIGRNKPCLKCPYKLGIIMCVTNPCVECERDNYSAYDAFVAQTFGRNIDSEKLPGGGVLSDWRA